ncbi:MAG TPA: TonB-dependent hemoglobin/transferrin/lactoferrin family receptor [Luteibacter sp.]|nr:TonB-dependent hemoglobin/transferrin/lactoferrin family receptor [Luteibacter sp.]
MLRPTTLAALICLALALPLDASAAEAADATTLPRVTVTAIGADIRFDVPATITVIDRQQMDRHLVVDIRDLVRYEPGVSAIGSAGRWGLDSFSIRGLDGNRVSIQTDGVATASSFGFSTTGMRAGRNYVDLDTVKSVEIVRGPASALDPSDALGGTVRYVTRDPADYLRDGRAIYVSLKEQYASADRGLSSALTLAGGDKNNGIVFIANHRQSRATNNMGTVDTADATRTRPDPMNSITDSVLGKYVHTAASGREDRVTLDLFLDRVDTRIYSALDPKATQTRLLDDRARDTSKRLRASFEQRYRNLDGALADRLDWNVYSQQTSTDSRTRTLASVRGATYDRLYLSSLDERLFGGKAILTKGFANQTLSYGIELSRTTPTGQLGGQGTNVATGQTSSGTPFMPENYPLRFFPKNDTDRHAAFAQDEIALLDGRLKIVPGVRYDHYAFRPDKNDAYYNSSFVQGGLGTVEHDRASPKLGIVYALSDKVSAWAQYAQGFRPPLYSELAVAWGTPRLYGIVPNPSLKPETSRGLEVGIRGHGDLGYFNISAYYNRYRDFIFGGYTLDRSQWPQWAREQNLLIVLQAVNFPKATVKGAEATGGLELGAFAESLVGWRLEGSLSAARGDKQVYGATGTTPLNSVDPGTAVLGISYDASNWGVELIGKGVRRKNRLDAPGLFRAPGYATLDLFAHWSPSRSLELSIGLGNLADRRYWDWGGLHGGVLANVGSLSGSGVDDAQQSSAQIERLSMPGRSVSVSARYVF